MGRIQLPQLGKTGVPLTYREILGMDVFTRENETGWTEFLRGLVARGLSGAEMVTSDAHPGLKSAVSQVLPGNSWNRCYTHFTWDWHSPALETCWTTPGRRFSRTRAFSKAQAQDPHEQPDGKLEFLRSSGGVA